MNLRTLVVSILVILVVLVVSVVLILGSADSTGGVDLPTCQYNYLPHVQNGSAPTSTIPPAPTESTEGQPTSTVPPFPLQCNTPTPEG